MRMRVWVTGVGLVVLASGAAAGLTHRADKTSYAADRGTMTSSQYARAVAIAQSEIAKEHAKVTRAVADVVPGEVREPNLPGVCRSGHLLVVSLVGRFPHVIFGTGFAGSHARQGRETWVTVKADAITGEECLIGVSVGRFKPASDAANLLTSL